MTRRPHNGHQTVQGARIDGGEGGIRVTGNLDASVTASMRSGPTLQSAVEHLEGELRRARALDDPELADTVQNLQLVAASPKATKLLLKGLVKNVEEHPVFVASSTTAVTAAMQAVVQLLPG